MYRFRDDVEVKINRTIASEVIGIAKPTLSNILNRRVVCRKVTAFSITKYIDAEAEINDYFVKEK